MTTTKNTTRSVVFFGSGPVAARSLSLLRQHTAVEAVITKPTTTKEMAEAAPGIPQHVVNSKSELNDLLQSQTFESRLGVLIDFGIIISQEVIDSFELGVLNSHFSILPELRGPDPITFAILSGQSLTGVSLMLLVQKMDEGPVIAYGEQPLDGTETVTTLTERLILLSDGLLKVEVPRYMDGLSKGVDQEFMSSHSGKSVSYSRKLSKEDGIIDWDKPAIELEREVRAYLEWPKSRTSLNGIDIIITAAHVEPDFHPKGTIVVNGKQVIVGTAQGSLAIDRLKPAGKSEMTIEGFLAGYRSKL